MQDTQLEKPTNQSVTLTMGAVQRLISVAVESARADAQPAAGSGTMTIGELKQWAGLIREAGMIPAEDSKKRPVPQNVSEARAIAKIMAGHTWGINPFESQALMHFMEQSGQIVPDYKALLMRIKVADGCDYRIKQNDTTACVLVAYRNGRAIGESGFTLDQAIAAGLYSESRAKGEDKYPDGNPKKKGAWESFTADMLMSKAARRLFRDYFADLYSGVLRTKEDIEEDAATPAPAQITTGDNVPFDMSGDDDIAFEPHQIEAAPKSDALTELKVQIAALCTELNAASDEQKWTAGVLRDYLTNSLGRSDARIENITEDEAKGIVDELAERLAIISE